MQNLSSILFDHLETQPEKNILILQHAGKPDRPVTYKELISGAFAYTNEYQKCGISEGEVVVLILQHGFDLICAFWGAIFHGAIPSIMPFLTEKLLPERYRVDLASLISVTRPAAFVTYRAFEPEVKAALLPETSVKAIIRSEMVTDIRDWNFKEAKGIHRTPNDIALLQHSSGTTGLQKGVALSHQAILTQLKNYIEALRVNNEDVIVSWLPLYHDMGLIAGFLMPILQGIPLVLMSPFDWVRAPQRLMLAVNQYRGTLSWLPNFAYNFCVQKIRDRHLEGVDLSSWRAISNCSEPMRFESHQMVLEKFQSYGLNPQALTTCYAMAENVFAVTQGGIDEPVNIDVVDRDRFQVERIATPPNDSRPFIRMVSAGRPIPGVEVGIFSEKGKKLPEREVGEIALRSSCMLTEYYHRPEATQKAFRNGWYLTGDLGYLAGGELYVSGRIKDLIIVGGKNIYPQDLEELAMMVPGVRPGRVSAFGIYNNDSGTEDVVIVAEADEGDEEERERIANQIREVVTRNSAIALRNVAIVEPQWLVKTSSGKNARAYNREKYLAEINKDFFTKSS